MCFHGAPRHVELTGDLVVVAALQQEVGDLLFSGPKTNSLFFHFASYPLKTNFTLSDCGGARKLPRPQTLSQKKIQIRLYGFS